jgi:hypothetical protein
MSSDEHASDVAQINPVQRFREDMGGAGPWADLAPDQQENWRRLHRGEVDWEGNEQQPPDLNADVIDLASARQRRADTHR